MQQNDDPNASKPDVMDEPSELTEKEIKKTEDWRDEHGEPSFEYLQSLADDSGIEAMEKLKSIADDLDVEYDENTTGEELVDRIQSATLEEDDVTS